MNWEPSNEIIALVAAFVSLIGVVIANRALSTEKGDSIPQRLLTRYEAIVRSDQEKTIIIEELKSTLRELKRNAANGLDVASDPMVNLQKGNVEPAISHYRSLIKDSGFNTKSLAERYFRLGVLQYLDHIHEAIGSLEQATKLDPSNHAAWNLLGELNHKIGRYRQAIRCFEQFIDVEPTTAMCNIGRSYVTLGEYDKATSMITAALELEQKNQGDVIRIAKNLVNLGEIARLRGDLNQSLHYSERARRIFYDVDQRCTGYSSALGNIGLVHQAQKDFEKANSFFRQSLAVAEEIGDKERMANQYGNLGISHMELCQFDRAQSHYEHALALNLEIGRKEGIANQYGNMAILFQMRNESDKALEYFNLTLELDQELGRQNSIALGYTNIGTLHYQLGDYHNARENWIEALISYKEIGLTHREIEIERMLNMLPPS